MIMRVMSSLYADSMPFVHFNMFRAVVTDDIDQTKFSENEKFVLARREEFMTNGFGYNLLQTTKVWVHTQWFYDLAADMAPFQPFTIGFAIASSPLALLSYIGEKMYAWSDPERVDQQDILDTVALYWLSGSFPTSVMIYNQVGQYATSRLRLMEMRRDGSL
jgi:hypothetical protein